jgi:hypothetical protein
MARLLDVDSPVNLEEEDVVDQLEEDEDEPTEESEQEIEQKYVNNQAQLFIQRNDFLIPNILQMVQNKEILDLAPSYQRRLRWSQKKQSHLIESLLMNVPIPPVFLYEREFAKYEVMDGQQRLAAIKSFFANEFELQGLRKWPELNDRRYRDLPPKIQAGLTRRGLSAVIILTESSQDKSTAMELRQYVFERLNTGGERLNAQEVRNCIYASHFNDILIKVARSDAFTSAWGVPPKETGEPHQVSKKLANNRLYSTMADCEIVLRYFALSDLNNFKSGMKKTLDECMKSNLKSTKVSSEKMRKDYTSVLSTAQAVYGGQLFHLPGRTGDLDGRRSIPLADAVLLGIRHQMRHANRLIERRDFIVSETVRLLSDQGSDSYIALVGRGNTKKAIEDRLEVMRGVFARAIQK